MLSTNSVTRTSVDLLPATAFCLDQSEFVLSAEPFTPQMLILLHQQHTAFENIVGKEEIARNKQFLLFPQCFLLNQKIVSPFVNIYDVSSFAAEFEEPKIGM